MNDFAIGGNSFNPCSLYEEFTVHVFRNSSVHKLGWGTIGGQWGRLTGAWSLLDRSSLTLSTSNLKGWKSHQNPTTQTCFVGHWSIPQNPLQPPHNETLVSPLIHPTVQTALIHFLFNHRSDVRCIWRGSIDWGSAALTLWSTSFCINFKRRVFGAVWAAIGLFSWWIRYIE